MNSQVRRRVSTLRRSRLLGLVALLACDGDGGRYESGLDDSKKLNALSPTEVQNMCAAQNAWAKEHVLGATCHLLGVTTAFGAGVLGQGDDASVRLACNMAYSDCKRSGLDACGKPKSTCDVTVAQYEICMNDMAALINNLASGLPACDQLTVAMLRDGTLAQKLAGVEQRPPASCKEWEEKCD